MSPQPLRISKSSHVSIHIKSVSILKRKRKLIDTHTRAHKICRTTDKKRKIQSLIEIHELAHTAKQYRQSPHPQQKKILKLMHTDKPHYQKLIYEFVDTNTHTNAHRFKLQERGLNPKAKLINEFKGP